MSKQQHMTVQEFRSSSMYGGWQTDQAKRPSRPSARPATPACQMRDTQEPIQEGEVVMIDLPFSPSVNNYWQRAKNGRLYIGKRGIEFRQKVISLIAKQDMRGKCGNALVDVALILHPPSRQIHDSDNYYKALFDALTKAKFWDDDSQVKLNVLLMGDIVSKGKIEMAVRLHCGAKIGAAELLSRV